jgi:AraC family transcriptional regulator
LAIARRPTCYGTDYARRFQLEEAPSLLVTRFSRVQFAAIRIRSTTGMSAWSGIVPRERSFLVSVDLAEADTSNWRTCVGGRLQNVASCAPGSIEIYDLLGDLRLFRDTAFDSVHYTLPRATLEAFTEDLGLPKLSALNFDDGKRDSILYHLTQILLPHLGSRDVPSDLFLDHFVLMFCGRIVDAYGAVTLAPRIYRGGLQHWQVQRARDLIQRHLSDGRLRLADLARECGLSVSHFARAFRRSFGSSVHRYFLVQRVERAKTLLVKTESALVDIALQTGFPDQAAFTRTFRAIVGSTPSKWRKWELCCGKQGEEAHCGQLKVSRVGHTLEASPGMATFSQCGERLGSEA